jgi:hypothetical protein
MFPVSLSCPVFIAPSVFSKVYFVALIVFYSAKKKKKKKGKRKKATVLQLSN